MAGIFSNDTIDGILGLAFQVRADDSDDEEERRYPNLQQKRM